MKIYDILESLSEGPNDPAIFKAIFLAGGPGSGKSYVANKLLTGQGLRPVNSDDVYEYLAQKKDLDLADPEAIASVDGQATRQHAKDLTDKNNDEVFVFNGWTFSSSPTINPFDHPVYDIWLARCY